MSSRIHFAVFVALALTACKKDESVGPQGPQGPAGADGQDGNANVDRYQFSLNLSAFYHYGSSHVWAEPAPSSVPNLQSDQLALVYVWMDPVDGAFEWVQQPFNHYFNSGNAFNEFFHGVESDGDLWLYIRNSTGGQPYSTMSGSLSYKVFVIESRMAEEMAAEEVNAADLDEVMGFFERRHYRINEK